MKIIVNTFPETSAAFHNFGGTASMICLPTPLPYCLGLVVHVTELDKYFNKYFLPQSYANAVDAIRLPSYVHCSWTRWTGLAKWTASVSLSVTMYLAQIHRQQWKKMLVRFKKQASNLLVSHLPPHKLLCLYMPKVPRHPQLPTSESFCNTFLFIYCAYRCAITPNHVRQNCAPSHYPLVREDPNIVPVDFSSSRAAKLPVSFLKLEMSREGVMWKLWSSSDGQILLHQFVIFPLPLLASCLCSGWVERVYGKWLAVEAGRFCYRNESHGFYNEIS